MNKFGENILIFGASGMLGREIYRESNIRGYKTTGVSRLGPDAVIDLLDINNVREFIVTSKPDVIINSAALVSHALCEEDPKLAYCINSRAIAVIAQAAREIGARLIHISTDHYFSGDGPKLHDELSPVTLLNEYARTKFAGEGFALTCPGALVVRTNITGLRGDGGSVPSFFEWVIGVLESTEKFNLFEDYYTSTISTRQAASILFDLLNHDVKGTINLACREVVSKKKFVETVAARMGVGLDHARNASVHEMLSLRAESVGLDVTKAEKVLGKKLPTLDEVVDQLLMEYQEDQCQVSDAPIRNHASA